MDYGICLSELPRRRVARGHGGGRGDDGTPGLVDGRPMPWLSARAPVEFGAASGRFFALRGAQEEMATEARAFEALGVEHLALWFKTTDPAEVASQAERFARDVAPLV